MSSALPRVGRLGSTKPSRASRTSQKAPPNTALEERGENYSVFKGFLKAVLTLLIL